MILVFLIFIFLLLNISLVRNMQRESLGAIINTLREEHQRGNLEELLVYYALESEPTVKRFYSIRTGHTLHQIMELLDEFGRERMNQQN